MYRAITIIIVVLSITVQSALAQPYFTKPDPKVLMVMERRVGCNAFGAHFVRLTGMKALNGKSVYYYDQKGKLKKKIKSIRR